MPIGMSRCGFRASWAESIQRQNRYRQRRPPPRRGIIPLQPNWPGRRRSSASRSRGLHRSRAHRTPSGRAHSRPRGGTSAHRAGFPCPAGILGDPVEGDPQRLDRGRVVRPDGDGWDAVEAELFAELPHKHAVYYVAIRIGDDRRHDAVLADDPGELSGLTGLKMPSPTLCALLKNLDYRRRKTGAMVPA